MFRKTLMIAAVCALAVAAVSGCADTPSRVAKTPLQHAYAALQEYNAAQEVGLTLVQDEKTPEDLKRGLIAAEAAATPIFRSATSAARDVERIRGEVKAGATDMEKLQIATANLDRWTLELRKAVSELESAILQARGMLKPAVFRYRRDVVPLFNGSRYRMEVA
jgi:hypothetical protein